MSVKPKQLSPAKLQKIVDDFNEKFPVGTPVYLVTGVIGKDEDKIETVVSRPAMILGFHSAVAWFEGLVGSYSIHGRVTPRS